MKDTLAGSEHVRHQTNTGKQQLPGYLTPDFKVPQTTDFKTLGITAACVVGGVILFCSLTGTNFSPTIKPPNPDRVQTRDRVHTHDRVTTSREAQRSLDQRDRNFRQQQKDIYDSAMEAKRMPWQN